jgi:hypothetical protein
VPTVAPAQDFRLAADEHIARVFAREHGHDREPRRQQGRQILRRMHRQIDLVRDQGLLDLLGEQALAADLGERPILDHIAAGADDLELECLGGKTMGARQLRPDHGGLRQRQRAATRSDPKHPGLHHPTSQCYAGPIPASVTVARMERKRNPGSALMAPDRLPPHSAIAPCGLR